MRGSTEVLILFAMLGTLTTNGQPAERLDTLFARGQMLLEANCSDCYRRSRQGLQEGIDLVERAIALGYPDKITAYKVLGPALRTMAFRYARERSDEGRRLLRKELEIYKELIQLAPRDREVAVRYAQAVDGLDGTAAAVPILEHALAVDPLNYGARQYLGAALIRLGQTEEGLAHLRRAFDESAGLDAEYNAEYLIRELTQLGRMQEAEDVRLALRKKQGKG